MNVERRAFTTELRMKMDGSKQKMVGRAAVFNSRSEVMTVKVQGKSVQFQEIIMPGAFRSALIDSDIRALFNHDSNLILGRTSAKTLRVAESDDGLDYEVDPPDTSYSRDLQVSMGRGDVNQCSFGFTVKDGGDKWERDASGIMLRTILPDGVDRVYDVSPVVYPAYPDTDCALRSLEKAQIAAIPTTSNTETYRRKLALAGKEYRVDMGYAGYRTVGQCAMCNMTGCLCPGCENVSYCNLQAGPEGACTRMMKPACLCLGCPNTDQATLKQMYSM